MIRRGILVHGGVGSPSAHEDGTRAAAEAGLQVLRRGGTALEAVVEAAVILENDGRFNAGRGSAVRIDGRSVEMDAAVMGSDGRVGAVACVSGVPNPVRLARRVLETPHRLIAGEGARALAALHGLAAPMAPSEDALRHHRALVRRLGGDGFDWRASWNFETPYEQALACDTIGAVALDDGGTLAAANSTGGASPMLRGRVGDSPLVGCGFYCGPAAAVVVTGRGERLIDRMLARWVYDRITWGESVERAVDQAVRLYEPEVPVGVLAVARRGAAASHNRDMAHSILLESLL